MLYTAFHDENRCFEDTVNTGERQWKTKASEFKVFSRGQTRWLDTSLQFTGATKFCGAVSCHLRQSAMSLRSCTLLAFTVTFRLTEYSFLHCGETVVKSMFGFWIRYLTVWVEFLHGFNNAQVPIPIFVLKIFAQRTIFYCHFPDCLLAPHNTTLQRLYRTPIDYVEEHCTGMVRKSLSRVEFRLTQICKGWLYCCE